MAERDRGRRDARRYDRAYSRYGREYGGRYDAEYRSADADDEDERYWPYGRDFFRYGAPVPGHGMYPDHHWGGGVVYGLEGAGYAPFGMIGFPRYGYEFDFTRPRRRRRRRRKRRRARGRGHGVGRRRGGRRERARGRTREGGRRRRR